MKSILFDRKQYVLVFFVLIKCKPWNFCIEVKCGSLQIQLQWILCNTIFEFSYIRWYRTKINGPKVFVN